MSDFLLVLTACGLGLIILAILVVLEYRGFKAQWAGDPTRTISAFINRGLFRTLPTACFASFAIGVAFCHFVGW